MFSIISADSPHHWDAILALPAGYIAAQNPPPGVPDSRWAQNVSVDWYASGTDMATAIAGGFNAGRTAIMIDELRSASITKVADCARHMRSHYPQHAGRWGCYLVTGTNVAYPGLQPAIDELLDARAMIACEMYAKQAEYNAAGGTKGERDTWLGDYFRGSRGQFANQGRIHWLSERRRSRGSDSHLSVLFGVTDKYVSDFTFLDRMFYVFVNRSGYRGLALASNGGVGSWKWDAPELGSSSRDVRFATSWDWYCRAGKTTLCSG